MITPYLTFPGHCRDALTFYSAAFDTVPTLLQPYGDYVPEGLEGTPLPAELQHWVLHAHMELCGTLCWFADELPPKPTHGNRVQLTATVPTKARAQALFDALGQNATITLPPTQTYYATFHAALVDRFGICWNIVAQEAPQP